MNLADRIADGAQVGILKLLTRQVTGSQPSTTTAATRQAGRDDSLISWTQILYGAALSAAAAAIALALTTRPRRGLVIALGALATAAGPIAWNAILHATHATTFFTDAPLAVLPASWQDTGSGVFALAATTLTLGLGPLANTPTRRVASQALLCGLVAFLIDVYLY